MSESTQAIFLRIATEKKLIDAEQARQLLEALEDKETAAAVLGLETIVLEKKLLSVEQVKGIARGVRYYIVRRADKRYGRLACKLGFIDEGTLENCLKKQKLDYTRRRRLVRLSKLLLEVEAITKTQDAKIRARVLAEEEAERAKPPSPIAGVVPQRGDRTNDKTQPMRPAVRLFDDGHVAVARPKTGPTPPPQTKTRTKTRTKSAGLGALPVKVSRSPIPAPRRVEAETPAAPAADARPARAKAGRKAAVRKGRPVQEIVGHSGLSTRGKAAKKARPSSKSPASSASEA